MRWASRRGIVVAELLAIDAATVVTASSWFVICHLLYPVIKMNSENQENDGYPQGTDEERIENCKLLLDQMEKRLADSVQINKDFRKTISAAFGASSAAVVYFMTLDKPITDWHWAVFALMIIPFIWQGVVLCRAWWPYNSIVPISDSHDFSYHWEHHLAPKSLNTYSTLIGAYITSIKAESKQMPVLSSHATLSICLTLFVVMMASILLLLAKFQPSV